MTPLQSVPALTKAGGELGAHTTYQLFLEKEARAGGAGVSHRRYQHGGTLSRGRASAGAAFI